MEKNILVISAIIAIVSLVFTPKEKKLQSHFIFLFSPIPVWILGLSVVELGLLEYPVRELSDINRTSFIFEYLILPVVCIFFNAYYPSSSTRKIQIAYYLAFSSTLTLLESLLEKYTMLIKYTGWKWYFSLISMCIVFCLTRIVTNWFFKDSSHAS